MLLVPYLSDMLGSTLKKYLRFFLPVFLGIGLLFFPLLGDFHFESALVVSLGGCFWAGIRGCKKNSANRDFFAALAVAGYLFLVGIPLLVNALVIGCFSVDGLAFWLLFPLPSVFFGYSLGRLLRSWDISYRRLITVVVLVGIGLGIFLYEFFTYPQVYFFNHVWGGWPGPIYDETVRINGATVFFRSLTLLWAVLLWHVPILDSDQYSKWIIGFSAIAIIVGYTQLNEFGVISPPYHIQNTLKGHHSTKHFDLYYDRTHYSDTEVALLATEHEFYLSQISQELNLALPDTSDKIESYLYGHPWQKKQLVGAKFTSYVPVWLEQDQLHIAKQQIGSSLKHELVHVLAKQFGNKLFNASWSIGMIEGLAVAIDGGSSLKSTIDQIVVSEKPYPNAEELQKAFSPWGFYSGRSGVNYITAGSFVRFLMRDYPIKSLKDAYRTGNIATSYEQNWESLTANWHQYLDTVRVDSVDREIAGRIFGIPSLFEQECPHVVSDFAAAWDTYRFNMAEQDTAAALVSLNRAVAALPSVKSEWSFRQLVSGDPQTVRQAATLQDTTVELQLLFADAFALSQNWSQADRHLKQAQSLYAANPDSLLEEAIALRMNREQWAIYRQMRYKNKLPDSSTFANAYYRTKIRSLSKALEQEREEWVKRYSRHLITIPLHHQYFNDYQQLIHQLVFLGELKLASTFIDKVSALNLRQRYRKRLQQERRWLEFWKKWEGI